MSLAWEPNKSCVTREDAPTDAPPKPGPKPKRRGKVVMHAPGDIQGMVRLRKKNDQHSNVITGLADELAIDDEFGALTGAERHIISAYESGLIDDNDLDLLL